MKIHDETATTLSLARVALGAIDRSREQTTIRTATLVLLLEKLIELGAPGSARPVEEASSKQVRSIQATFDAMTEHRG